MIVCLCHRISDRDIHGAVRDGAVCFEQVQDDTRVASSCGSCHDCAREVFDAALQGCGRGCAGSRAAAAVPAAAVTS